MDPSLQPLLALLTRLSAEFREVREGVNKAIRIAGEDPEMALTRARKVMELVIREIHQRRCGEPPGTRPLENLIQRLVKDGYLPTRLEAFANTVRMLGNVGTHRFGENITAADVGRSLSQLEPILEWYFLEERPDAIAPGGTEPLNPEGTSGPPLPASRPESIIAIVPKGLRSFDAKDADFFLDLLPGPRDRSGLPESIRFWKHRIEEKDEPTFTVGVIYGPSGCGKSSLVKAGLLPRLASRVLSVYIEATADDTEARLLQGLRRRCPGLSGDLDLAGTIVALRQGSGRKVLIVLDQFEQWLHAHRGQQDTELATAVRQCDGERVQCIVMVRDDFWMALTRFMNDLHIELVQGQNSAAVDLFDQIHARHVLSAFGRAFGRLSDEPPREQAVFLDQAVAGLSQDGRVICVRLALFAEMVKGKPWTPAILREVGGTEGVGVAFLEETFGATASPKNRLHQQAARSVLKALLPEQGSDIKGNMQAHDKLLEASGYARRPKEFEDVLRFLDGELRLITPTEAGEQAEKYYQLTHDYLVPSLRDWLTRKQKETRRGRAELLLADRAGVWNARQENRQLPSLWQWCSIRWWTQKKSWTPPQKKMMGKASRYHVGRVVVGAAILVLVVLGGREGYGRLEGRRLRDRVLDAKTIDVPGIVKEMASYRRWVDPLLQEAYAQAQRDDDPLKQLHASLALVPVDSGQVEYLYERLLKGEPQEVVVIREALLGHKADLTERLWTLLENPKNDQAERFRAACALATFAPDDPRWEKVRGDVAETLVVQEPFVIAQWAEALKGVGRWLIPPLADFLVDEKRSGSAKSLIAKVYGNFAADVPNAYDRLEKQLDKKSAPAASIEAKIVLAKRQASIGTALLVIGRGEKVWPLLQHRADPTLRSYLIERLGPGGVDPKMLTARLEEEQKVSVKRAVLLSLGEFGLNRLSLSERRNHLPWLLQLYRDDPDPGIHGAAEWLLRRWEASDKIKAIDKGLATGKVKGKRQWYINRQGQAMMIVPKPGEVWLGADDEDELSDNERHKRRINRIFAIASREVTVEQFLRFRMDHEPDKDYAPTGDCPVNMVSWYDAAAYCNWLSEREGIPKDQWCYEPNEKGKYAEGMKMAANYLQRTGYRLPTEAEWEYSCRAGAGTRYSFGEPVDLLGKYAWFNGSSLEKSHPVGSLKSNDLGLFDMHGNAREWCQDRHRWINTKGYKESKFLDDIEDILSINEEERAVRNGSFLRGAWQVRSAFRIGSGLAYPHSDIGFRPARTFR